MIKNNLQLILSLLIVLFSACNDKDEPSDAETKTNMLAAATWGNAVVTHGSDMDVSDQYSNFAITFTNNASGDFLGTYVVADGGYAFADASGKWKFNSDLTQIVFDSGKEMAFELTDRHLKLDFTVTDPGGRTNGLSGHFVFDLQPL